MDPYTFHDDEHDSQFDLREKEMLSNRINFSKIGEFMNSAALKLFDPIDTFCKLDINLPTK